MTCDKCKKWTRNWEKEFRLWGACSDKRVAKAVGMQYPIYVNHRFGCRWFVAEDKKGK